MLKLRHIRPLSRLLISHLIICAFIFEAAGPAYAIDNDSPPPTQTGRGGGPPPPPTTPVMLFNGGDRPRPPRKSVMLHDPDGLAYVENGEEYFGGDVYRPHGSPYGTDVQIALDFNRRTTRTNFITGELEVALGAPRDEHGYVKVVTASDTGQLTLGVIVPPSEGAASSYGRLYWYSTATTAVLPDAYEENGRLYHGNDLYRRGVKRANLDIPSYAKEAGAVDSNQTFDIYFEFDPRWPTSGFGDATIHSVIRDASDAPILRLETTSTVNGKTEKIVSNGLLQKGGRILYLGYNVDLNPRYEEMQKAQMGQKQREQVEAERLQQEQEQKAFETSKKMHGGAANALLEREKKSKANQEYKPGPLEPADGYIEGTHSYYGGDLYKPGIYFAMDPASAVSDGNKLRYSVIRNFAGEPIMIAKSPTTGESLFGVIVTSLDEDAPANAGKPGSRPPPTVKRTVRFGKNLILPAQLEKLQNFKQVLPGTPLEHPEDTYNRQGHTYNAGDVIPAGLDDLEVRLAVDPLLDHVTRDGRHVHSVARNAVGQLIVSIKNKQGSVLFGVLDEATGKIRIGTSTVVPEQLARIKNQIVPEQPVQSESQGPALSPEEEAWAPENLSKTLGPSMTEQLGQISQIDRGNLSDIGRTAMNITVNTTAGATAFYMALGATAFYLAHWQPSTNPMAIDEFFDQAKSPAMMLTLLSFSMFAYPFFSKLNIPGNRTFGRALSWNVMGMVVAGVASRAVQLMAQDPDVRNCLGFAGKKPGEDEAACSAAYRRWDGQYLIENFTPIIVNSALAAGAVVSGARLSSLLINRLTPNSVRLFGMRLVGTKMGAWTFQIGLVVAGTVVYFKAYELSAWATGISQNINNYFLSHGSWRDEKDGPNVSDAQDSFMTAWKQLREDNFVPPSWGVLYDQGTKSADKPADYNNDTLARVMYHFDAKMHEWRQSQLGPAYAVFYAWARKVTNFNLTRKFTYDVYNKAIDLIAAERKDPTVSEKFDADFVETVSRGERLLSASAGVDQLARPPVKSIGFAGTKNITDYIVASMACGVEAEAEPGDPRNFASKGWDSFKSWWTDSWNTTGQGRQSAIQNSAGYEMAFHPPRITKPQPGNQSICMNMIPDNAGTGDGIDSILPARAFFTLITNMTQLDLSHTKDSDYWIPKNTGRKYMSILAYIREDLRPTVLSDDGTNHFSQWWQKNIETDVEPVQKQLQGEYNDGVLGTFSQAMASDQTWCYTGTRTTLDPKKFWLHDTKPRASLDVWPSDAKMSGKCSVPSQRFLARGILPNIHDEFEVYYQFLIDAISGGDPDSSMMTTDDQAKFLVLASKFEDAFNAMTAPSNSHIGVEAFIPLKKNYVNAYNDLKVFIHGAVEKASHAIDAGEVPQSPGSIVYRTSKKFPKVLANPAATYKGKLAYTAMSIIDGLAGELLQYIVIINKPMIDSIAPEQPVTAAVENLAPPALEKKKKPAKGAQQPGKT